jgi:hypothetical protein
MSEVRTVLEFQVFSEFCRKGRGKGLDAITQEAHTLLRCYYKIT